MTLSFQTLPVAALVFELDGAIASANPAAATLLGRDASELVGLTIHQVLPAASASWTTLVETARARGEAALETQLDGHGTVRRLQLVASIVPGPKPVVQVFALDITQVTRTLEGRIGELERAMTQSRATNIALEKLVEDRTRDASQARDRVRHQSRQFGARTALALLAEYGTLEEAAPRMLEAFGERFGWEVANLWIVDPVARVLRCEAQWTDDDISAARFQTFTKQTTFKLGESMPGRTWASRKPVWIDDVVEEVTCKRSAVARNDGIHGACAFPVIVEGAVIAVIEMLTPDVRRFDDELVATLETVGAQIGEFVERARAGEQRRSKEELAAKQRLESLGLVAGGIAHDFNNLLVGVMAESSAAREDRSLAEGTREALRRIEAAARRMAQLTRQLLAFAGRGQFVLVPVAADELLGEMREQLAALVRPDAKLEITLGAGKAVVEADPGLLRQVVMNLASNASDAGGKHVTISSHVVSRDGVPYWQLEVADDGVGIDSTTLTHMFEPFFSTKEGRHGLGLSAVHGIVRRIAGDVQVDSQAGQGSRFRVQIPIAMGAEPVRRPTSTDGMIPIPKLTGTRILVVDDEPSVRATVRRLLERRGALVVVASDGIEAEARLRDEKFDLVISDVSMPGRSGYDVLAIARAAHPGIQVVLMSGYTEKLRGEGIEEEADAFLEKPFTARALDSIIDEVRKGKPTAP